MTAGFTHRGWSAHFCLTPIPHRGFDWTATHPDYGGAPDGCTIMVHAADSLALVDEIDAWHEDNDEPVDHAAINAEWHALPDDARAVDQARQHFASLSDERKRELWS